MTPRRLGLAAAGLVALTLAAGLAGPVLIDGDRLRPELEAAGQAALGWPVALTGPVRLRLLPLPAVTADHVTVGTAGFERVTVDLALLPLLGGHVQVTGLDVSGGRIGGLAGLEARIGLDNGFSTKGQMRLGEMTVAFEAQGGPRTGGGQPVRAVLFLPAEVGGGRLRLETIVTPDRADGRVWLDGPSLAAASEKSVSSSTVSSKRCGWARSSSGTPTR